MTIQKVTVNMPAVSICSFFVILILFCLYPLFFTLPQSSNFSFISSILNYKLAVLILVGVVLHELVHGIFFAVYNPKGFSAVRFGVMWKYLAAYCSCSEVVTVKKMRIVLIMPLIFTGILPFILSIVLGNELLFLASIIMISGASGDLAILWKLRKYPDSFLALDMPDEVGTMVFDTEGFESWKNSQDKAPIQEIAITE